ncbi:hypothetical protein SAY86_013078 [Trapa natans]|uniref:Uncharacterized protein n=1 Tax=Trapa natans TaxID=22666 RepID=A0AAN7LYZ3_TRANT|nr:hypothetical protein SAY86_013078 [Trapa natans]
MAWVLQRAFLGITFTNIFPGIVDAVNPGGWNDGELLVSSGMKPLFHSIILESFAGGIDQFQYGREQRPVGCQQNDAHNPETRTRASTGVPLADSVLPYSHKTLCAACHWLTQCCPILTKQYVQYFMVCLPNAETSNQPLISEALPTHPLKHLFLLLRLIDDLQEILMLKVVFDHADGSQ